MVDGTAAATQSPGMTNHSSHRDFEQGEILSLSLDETALAIAKALDFAPDYLPGDGETGLPLTRLHVPAGIDTLTALRTLRIALPGQTVALNSLYRIYQRKSGSSEPGQTYDLAPNCTAEQCRPRTLIGWKDQLRACSAGLAIGMIDTGLDIAHPALAAAAGHIVAENFHRPGKASAAHEHGTGVAALLVGDARSGVPGLIPDVTLYAADAFYGEGDQAVTDTVSLLKALDWMRRKGVRIVNMSFAGPADPLIEVGIRQSIDDGMIVIAAAGNEGAGAPPAFPAAYPGVSAVPIRGAAVGGRSVRDQVLDR